MAPLTWLPPRAPQFNVVSRVQAELDKNGRLFISASHPLKPSNIQHWISGARGRWDMVTGKWAFIYLTPVLRICCNFFVYSERCASQLVMIYWLCQRNNSHMVKPKTLNIYVHVIMQSHCEPLFITHWWYGFVVTLFVCADIWSGYPAAKLLCSRDQGIAQAPPADLQRAQHPPAAKRRWSHSSRLSGETTQRHQWTISGQLVDNQWTTQWTIQWTTAFYRVL